MINTATFRGMSVYTSEESFNEIFKKFFYSHFKLSKRRPEYIDDYYNIMSELLSDIEMGKTRADASKRYEDRGVNVTFTILRNTNLPYGGKAICFTIAEESEV